MSAVATRSGVAKATLYNHFRTKDDVLRALVLREVELLADDADAATAQARADGADLVAAAAAGLARAGGIAAEHVAARRVAAEDPGALAPLLVADDGPAGSPPAPGCRPCSGSPPDDPLVRLAAGWVVGQVLDPQDPAAQMVTATALARAAAQSRRGLRDPAAALEEALSGALDPGAVDPAPSGTGLTARAPVRRPLLCRRALLRPTDWRPASAARLALAPVHPVRMPATGVTRRRLSRRARRSRPSAGAPARPRPPGRGRRRRAARGRPRTGTASR